MMRPGEIGRRLRALWHRSRMAQDLDDEMRLHLALRQERLRRTFASPAEAAAAARRRFGDPMRLREDAMDAWGWRWLEQGGQDVRFALRTLIRNSGFALTAVCTLAMGIAASTAVFSVVSALVLRPLPFAEPDRLVQIYGTSPLDPASGPVPNVEEFRRRNQSLETIAGYEVTARYLHRAEGPERVMAVVAERELFSILGVPPLRGRTFDPTDTVGVAVVSEHFWDSRLGRDPSVIGTSLTLDDRPFTIIGVMPASFQFPYRAASLLTGVMEQGRTDLWIPMGAPPPHSQFGGVIGRLRRDVRVGSAQSELAIIARQLEAQDPEANRGRSVRIVPLESAVVSHAVRRPLFLLLGAVGLLLILACSNVANLLLVRLTLRMREVAVRLALGAGRLRLARQFLTESLLLSAAGGLAGLALARVAATWVMRIAGNQIPRAREVGMDWRVFLFVLAICTTIGVVLSLTAALAFGRRDARSILQESGGHSTVGAHSRRLRDGLVIAEVTLAFILAVGAAVLVRELVRLRATDPGMVTTNVVTFHLGHQMSTTTDVGQFYEIADRVEQLPGVRAAGFTQLLPLQNWGWTRNSNNFQLRGRPPLRAVFPIELRFVTPGYFRALGIPIRGRAFTQHDDRHARPVIMINETLARTAFPGEDPVGKETAGGQTIVGIVGDVRQSNLDRPSLPELYTPIAQNWSQLSELGLTLVVSTHDRPEQTIAPVRAVIREVSPNQAIFRIRTMDAVVAESLSDFTLYLSVIAVAGGLALVLATTGTYSVISHMATARTREFAIRVALGADRARVIRLIVGQGTRLTAVGLALGIFGVFAGGRLLQGLPVSVRPPDLITTAPIAALVAAVAIVACLVPARRAAVRDPIAALRSE